MADKTKKTQTEKVLDELEDMLVEIRDAGEEIATCSEWGSGSDAARADARKAIENTMKFIKTHFTIKEQ